MSIIRYFHLDTTGSALLSCLKHWICIFSGPRLGHECGDDWTCKNCNYFMLNF